MMKTEKILPTVGIENQAVRLDIEEKNLVVTTKTCDWPDSSSKPKVAAINSFGYGGSNAHLIVREADTKNEHSVNVKKISHHCKGSMKVFVISARSQAALVDSAVSFSDWLLTLEDNDENISNVCYTLCERRSNYNARLAIAAANLKEARELLTRFSVNPKDKSQA
ncbi:uncharacterized protein LOC135690921 [Rhopilema esculentum]|uniref:uncharacterized protein LOC135690921 n=1 Tax=Rhopilema esculentum TaxID=499914 RepID=UPI0031D57725